MMTYNKLEELFAYAVRIRRQLHRYPEVGFELPRTVALGMLNAVAILLCVRVVVPLFFLPALAALIGSLLLEPMFKPFMPQETPVEEDTAE